MNKLVFIFVVVILILIFHEKISELILPTKNKKRREEKKQAEQLSGDYDETLKLNKELTKNKTYTHGTARFLSDKEKEILKKEEKIKEWKIGTKIKKNCAGIVIGQKDDDTLEYNGEDDHAIILASTGGGKTTTFVKPSTILLMHSKENIFLFDPKQEMLKQTSTLAKELNYNVYNLNLSNKDTGGRWNPFWNTYQKYLSKDLKTYYESIDEVSKLESLLNEIDKTDKGSEPIWENSEKGVYGIGILLMFEFMKRMNSILDYYRDNNSELHEEEIIFESMILKYKDRENFIIKDLKNGVSVKDIKHKINMMLNFESLFNIIRVISRRENNIPKIKDLIENDLELKEFSNIIFIKSEILLDSAETTYQSQMATPKAKLQKLNNPLVVDVLSGYPGTEGYIDLEKIVSTDSNIIYCNVREDDRTFSYIAQMFLTSIYSSLKTEADNQKEAKLKTKFHFLLEEFGNFPKIEGLPGMLTLSRGIGIRFYFVLQSFAQLTLVYGKDTENVLKSNVMLMSLPINDLPTAKELSEIFGNATIEDIVVDEEVEGNNNLLDDKKYKNNIRVNNIGRAIKTPDELLIIRMGEVYIKKQQLRPIFSKMPIIFLNNKLKSLLRDNVNLIPRKLEKHAITPEIMETILKYENIKNKKDDISREEVIHTIL